MIQDEFAALVEEYRISLMGTLIYGFIYDIVKGNLRRNGKSGEDEVDDAVQEFIEGDLLINQGDQLRWIFENAMNLAALQKMTRFRFRKHRARISVRTVSGNLWKRSQAVLREAPFVTQEIGRGDFLYRLLGVTVDDIQVTPTSVIRAVILARRVPRLISSATERNPKLYDSKGLNALLEIFLAEVKGPANNKDLQDFFKNLLTPWKEPGLISIEENKDMPTEISSEDEVMVLAVVELLRTDLGSEGCLIFGLKFANIPDRSLATRLGMSRPTAADRKDKVFEKISERLEGLDKKIQEAILSELYLQVVSVGIG